MTNPKISIIVPLYNTERYLQRCFDSLVNQTLKEIEIILVNDGSTDNSSKICDEYAKRDRRIKVIHKENGGVSSARNTGMELASGEFLAFVDSDDYVTKEYIGRMLEYYKKYPEADIVIFGQARVIGNKTTIHTPTEEALMNREEFGRNFFQLLSNRVLDTTTNCLYRTSLAKILKFSLNMQVGEDSLFNFQYLTLCKKFVLSKEYGYFAVRRSSSIMGQLHSRYSLHFELEKFLEMHRAFQQAFIKIGISPEIIEERYIKSYPIWFYSIISNVFKKETPYNISGQIKQIGKIIDYHRREGITKKIINGNLGRVLHICYFLKHPFLIWIFLKVFFFYTHLKHKLKKTVKLLIS